MCWILTYVLDTRPFSGDTSPGLVYPEKKKTMNYQVRCLRKVQAEEKKHKYNQQQMKYLNLREWALESRESNTYQENRSNRKGQQKATNHLSGPNGVLPSAQEVIIR